MFKGWSNGERALAVGMTFAVVILALLAISHAYYPHECDTKAGAQDGGDDWVRWLDLLAQWTMAFGTLAVFRWTVKSLVHSEKTAADALKASTAANNAYINKEIGLLVIDHIAVRSDGIVDISGRHLEGSVVVSIIGCAARFQVVDKEVDADDSDFKSIGMTRVIVGHNDPFQTINGRFNDDMPQLFVPDEVQQQRRANPGKYFLGTFQFLYHCAFGMFCRRMTFIIHDDHRYDPTFVKRLWFNLPHESYVQLFPEADQQRRNT